VPPRMLNGVALCIGVAAALLLAFDPPPAVQPVASGGAAGLTLTGATTGWGHIKYSVSYSGPALLALAFVLQFVAWLRLGPRAHVTAGTGTVTVATPKWRYYFGRSLPTDDAALERLAVRLGVSMSGTAATFAGRTATDTAVVQQRIRDAIRGQREGWLWLVAVLAAVVSVVGASSSWRAVGISARALDLNQRAFDLNQRAWLMGTGAKLEVRQDGVLVIATTFKNFGKSPAFDVRHNVGITGVHSAPDDGDALKGGSEVHLPEGGTVTTAEPRPDVTPDQVKLIVSGAAPFFVWLRIKYVDPFSSADQTRDTLECWRYDARQPALVVCAGGQYHR
jgi:hypothetical protein